MRDKKSNILLTILIPVKNEKIHIKVMIKILTHVLEIPYEIFVIYDSPKDTTVPVVKKLARQYGHVKLIYNKDKGITNALLTGIAKASGSYILTFVTDDVGPVLAIEDMVELMKKGCDLVSCTRYAYGGRRLGGSMLQRLLSTTGNYLFRRIIGITLTDSTTGIKMFRKNITNEIELESQIGWAVIFELAIKAQLLGMQLGEVPIISIDRLYGGSSTFKVSPWFKEYVKWFFFGIVNLRLTKKKQKKVLLSIPANIG